jgi:hypothetical protein
MDSILNKKYNIYSQNGEDGIIDYIFTKLNIHKGTFIEFGAWDGKHLSNSYNLFLNKEWNGIYIEADSNRYNDLVSNFHNVRDRIDCINAFVGFTENDNLDTLIETYSTKREFDFVSIDVDGLDYFIFNRMNRYLPKVICIEVNAGHDPEYSFVIPEQVASNNIGQSIKVISSLAINKGYFPLCYTGNLFLVKNEYVHLFRDDIRTFSDMYVEFLQHLGRDGVLHLKNTFVLNKLYNGFLFENEALEKFCKCLL